MYEVSPPTGRRDRARRPRIVYWNNIPTPYMVDRFNAVADRGRLDFEAWFSTRTEPDRSWAVDEPSWRFPYRYLPGFGSGEHRFEMPTALLGAHRPDLLVSLYASPSFVLGRVLTWVAQVTAAFWVETTFDAWLKRRRWKEWLKRTMFTSIDGVITPGHDGRVYAYRCGTPADKIFLVPHTIDVERFSTGSAQARQHRDATRARLGVTGCTFIYVGRLWRGKGLQFLLEAFGATQRRSRAPVSLLFVGDGPDESRLRRYAADLKLANVVFAGFQSSADLPDLYAASDVFVFPTLGDPYGLVLDEAMACSLPLISTSAAGELELRIDQGRNGLIVQPGDSAALAAAMSKLEREPDLRSEMGRLSRTMVEGRTPARWAEDFERAVAAILLRKETSRSEVRAPR